MEHMKKLLTSNEVVTLLLNIGKNNKTLSPNHLFIEQAKALNTCEITDRYEFTHSIGMDIRHYSNFNRDQLRGYVYWRSRQLKKPTDYPYTFSSYFGVYMAELINLIGCKSVKDAFKKLQAMRNQLLIDQNRVTEYTIIENQKVIRDFIIFHNLGSDLLYKELDYSERMLLTFLNLSDFTNDQVYATIKGNLDQTWIDRQFTNLNRMLIVRVLRAIDKHTREIYQKSIAEFLFNVSETTKNFEFFKGLPFVDTSDQLKINALPTLRYEKLTDSSSENKWIEYKTVSDISQSFPKIIKEIGYIIEGIVLDSERELPITLSADVVDLIKKTAQNFFKEVLNKGIETQETKKLKAYMEYKKISENPPSYKFKDSTEAIKKAKEMETLFENILDTEKLFLVCAKVLENVEQHTEPVHEPIRPCLLPSFQLLTVNNIKSYLYWRTGLRNGKYRQTNYYFQLIYLSELINLIGCKSIEDAYEKLLNFKNNYKFKNSEKKIINSTLANFSKYYNLNNSYSNIPDRLPFYDYFSTYFDESFEQTMLVFGDIFNKSDDEIFNALLDIEEKTIKSSVFYKNQPEVFKSIMVKTLRQTAIYAQQKGKNSWLEIFFGNFEGIVESPFEHLVFKPDISYIKMFIHHFAYYERKNGIWYFYYFVPYKRHNDNVSKYLCSESIYMGTNHNILGSVKFKSFLETVDSYARIEMKFKSKKAPKLEDEWIKEVVKKAIEAMLSDERQAKIDSINFDISILDGIRSKAEQTKEKLLTEEEKLDIQEKTLIKVVNINAEKSESETESNTEGIDCLSKQEKRFLNCLLKNTSTNWIIKEGLTFPILCDNINEKLYTMFEDNVIENGALIEDYVSDLKEKLLA